MYFAPLRAVRCKHVSRFPSSWLGDNRAILPRLVSRVLRRVRRIAVAAGLALPAHVVDADLTGLETVEERLQVGGAHGEDREALDELCGYSDFPKGKRSVLGLVSSTSKVDLGGGCGYYAVRQVSDDPARARYRRIQEKGGIYSIRQPKTPMTNVFFPQDV